MVKPAFFTEFDQYWRPWNPAEDAIRLAVDMLGDADFPTKLQDISDKYGWDARRLNPAITYLYDRDMLFDTKTLGSTPFVLHFIMWNKGSIRRFVKSRR